MLVTLLKKVAAHSLQGELEEIAIICEPWLPKVAKERLEEIDSEVDEIVAEIMKIPSEDDVREKHPALCDGCEE
jgi:hypothetical protein